MISLPEGFLGAPLAHRGFHDLLRGRPENSASAFTAAISAGYGIELDVQLSADGEAMVFHDYDLARLTAESGPIRQRGASELAEMALTGGTAGIPRLAEILGLVAGQVPLLIEIKDQDGALGQDDLGPLEQATAAALRDYRGPVAVMSFNPHAVAVFADHAPATPVGLTTCGFASEDWALVPGAVRDRLRGIPDFERIGATFISHDANDLSRARVKALKSQGVPILCWTVRSPEAEQCARRTADNITFEGYAAGIPRP